ncbi:MAG: efflux RND transporter periplasmic adaptor subunit, partial [Methylococcaceae bacterium]
RVELIRPYSMAMFLSFFALAVSANNDIKLANEQLDNLGIVLGKPQITTEIPLLSAPAKVTIPSAQDYMVSSNQAGLITTLTAAIGDNVKQGQLLAKINSPDLISLQSQYLSALNNLKLANAAHVRDTKLFKEGIIAQRREQETLSLYNAAAFAENEAKQLLTIAGLSKEALNKLANTGQLNSELEIRSPITGAVIERNISVGARIDSATPLYRIANLQTLWLEINIPQEFSNSVLIGDAVLIDNTDISGKISLLDNKHTNKAAIRGKITLLGQSINPTNQSLLARASITMSEQSDIKLRAGENCTVQIMRRSEQTIFTVPNTAIAQHEGNNFIFSKTKDGFSIKAINIIGKQGDNSIISGELSSDEPIAIKGSVALKATWLGLGSYE